MQPDPQPDVDAMVADLRTALDEDERLARAAVIPAHDGPGAYNPHPELARWKYEPGGEVEYVSTPEMQAQQYADTYRVTCDNEGILPAVDERVGPHIARHDPARVLRLVAAHRAILELYERTEVLIEENAQETAALMSNPGDRASDIPNLKARGWELFGARRVLHMVIYQLASAYADRDGSDESGRAA